MVTAAYRSMVNKEPSEQTIKKYFRKLRNMEGQKQADYAMLLLEYWPKLVVAVKKYAKDKGNNNLDELFSTCLNEQIALKTEIFRNAVEAVKGNNNLNELFSTAAPTRKRKKYYVCIEEEVSESDQVGHIELGNLLTTIGKAMIGQTPNEPVGQTNHPVNKFSHLEHGNNPPVNQVGHIEHNA